MKKHLYSCRLFLIGMGLLSFGVSPLSAQMSYNDPGNIEIFGYGFFTPNVNEFKQYMNETALFTNTIIVDSWNPGFGAKMEESKHTQQKAILALHNTLFRQVGPGDWELDRGVNNNIPFQYRQNFQNFRNANASYINSDRIVAMYVADEPYWNGISPADYNEAIAYIKSQFPTIPTFVSLGPVDATMIGAQNIQIPTDWVSYNQYGVLDPAVDPMYQQNLKIIQGHMKPGARTFYIMDGIAGGALPLSDMDDVARNYFDMARMDSKAIGIGVFLWDSLDGTREAISQSEDMVREHIEIGVAITGKCGIPADVHPLDGTTVNWFRSCRFYATVEWTDFQQNTEFGQTADFGTDETGVYWFFGDANLEMMVKILDGCGFNNHFWVFAAAATNVGYDLEVTDTATGTKKNYTKPVGTFAPAITDTQAFPSCQIPSQPPGPAYGEPFNWTGSSGCSPSNTVHCLNQGRFKVEVDWHANGNSGPGRTVPYGTDETGLFWFFGSNNWELMIKVLKGCGFNNHYWVFLAGTTNVGFDVTITDTDTGQVWTHTNPSGNVVTTIADTDAFDCP